MHDIAGKYWMTLIPTSDVFEEAEREINTPHPSPHGVSSSASTRNEY